jgi:flagellar biosynthetic protein FliR
VLDFPLSLDTLPVFFLVAIRAISVMVAAPVFSAKPFPAMARIGLGLLLALLLTPTFSRAAIPPLEDWRIPGMVLTEAIVGLVLGFTAQLFYQTLRMAAALVEIQMGFTFSGLVDPLQGVSESVLAQFYTVFSVLVFLSLNGHHLMLIGLARSFDALPLGDPGVLTLSADRWISMSSLALQASIQMSLPVVGALLLTDVALAMLARTAPAMNVMITAAPAKVAIGFLAITAALPVTFALFGPQVHGLVQAGNFVLGH